jgi:hypothetical protein
LFRSYAVLTTTVDEVYNPVLTLQLLIQVITLVCLSATGIQKLIVLLKLLNVLSCLVEVNLLPTVSRTVRFGVRRPSGTRDQFSFLLEISFRQLRVCYFVAPSLTRGRVYNFPQEQGGPVIPPGTGFPFCRLLRLAGLRWMYSNPPPHGLIVLFFFPSYILLA